VAPIASGVEPPSYEPAFEPDDDIPTVPPPSFAVATLIPNSRAFDTNGDTARADDVDAIAKEARERMLTPELIDFVPPEVPPAAASRVVARDVELGALGRQDTQPAIEDAYDLVGYLGQPRPAYAETFGDVLAQALGLALRR
jgi:hypothetical protein